MSSSLWVSAAITPHGNEYGAILVLADTRQDAIEKAKKTLESEVASYVPAQQYIAALLENLDSMSSAGDVFIDWGPTDKRR